MRIKIRIFAIVLTFVIMGFTTAWVFAQEIKLGALQDTTGATSDVGKDEALGVREAVQYYNDKGGINGKKIRLFQYDYGYRVPEAITTYKRFRDYDKVAMVLGWGTGDTKLSRSLDKMPYLTSSFSGHLTDPRNAVQLCLRNRLFNQCTEPYIGSRVWKKEPKERAEG
jgi:branched-chain amino acid transport system substrate-binding protein